MVVAPRICRGGAYCALASAVEAFGRHLGTWAPMSQPARPSYLLPAQPCSTEPLLPAMQWKPLTRASTPGCLRHRCSRPGPMEPPRLRRARCGSLAACRQTATSTTTALSGEPLGVQVFGGAWVSGTTTHRSTQVSVLHVLLHRTRIMQSCCCTGHMWRSIIDQPAPAFPAAMMRPRGRG